MTAMAACTAATGATTCTWTNAAGGNFNDPLNWNNGAGPVPTGADSAQFNLAQNCTTILDVNPASGDLLVAAGTNATLVTDGTARTWSMSGNVLIDGGNLTLGA
jgi:hypothetical protein